MSFDRNQTEFSDCLKQRIWEVGTHLLPLDITLPYVPEHLKNACVDLYNFSYNLLVDMNNNSEKFDLSVDDQKTEHENIQQIEFYYWYLVNLAKHKNNQDKVCVMPLQEYEKWIKKFNSKSIQSLSRHGMRVTYQNDNVMIENDLYPGMLLAAKETYDAGYRNYKVNCGDFLLTCDFRAIAGYKRTFEDLHITLNDRNRAVATQIHHYALTLGIKPQNCNYFYRVEYKLKGKIVYISDLVSKNQLKINIGFAPVESEGLRILTEQMNRYEDKDEFVRFCHGHFAKSCINCKPICDIKSNPFELLGKKRAICARNPFIRILDPKEKDLKYIGRLIELRTMLIQINLSQAFYPGNG